jgi:LPXTG-motif cell wall-anchored protein
MISSSSFNKSNKSRSLVHSLCFLGLASLVAIPAARADEWNKKTILTVNEPIQVTRDLLQPGKYVFKLIDSQSDRHVVQIFNEDQSHLIDTILAIPNYRMRPEGRQFAFYETPAGYAKAVRAWFYPGDNFGQEFTYPKNLALLTAAVVSAAPSASAIQPEPKPEPQPAPIAETPAPVTPPEPPAAEPAPTETATNSAPEQPAPAAADTSQSDLQTTPSTLPKTGSTYPLFGLLGLSSLGLFSLLRMKRTA